MTCHLTRPQGQRKRQQPPHDMQHMHRKARLLARAEKLSVEYERAVRAVRDAA